MGDDRVLSGGEERERERESKRICLFWEAPALFFPRRESLVICVSVRVLEREKKEKE